MLLLLLLGLSPVLTVATQTTAVQRSEAENDSSKKVEAMLDAVRKKVQQQAEEAELMSQAEELYRQGEALYNKGDRDAAALEFAKARQLILSNPQELFYEPTVHTYFLKLADRVAQLEGATVHSFPSEGRLQIEANEQVRAFIRYFQGKGHGVVQTALTRLGQYEGMMRRIFREQGVPEDLIYVGLVESAYNPYSQSTAGAEGIWQFVRQTGRRYGLRQVGPVDDRHDPEKSTRAAALYLRDLYQLFGNWPLALAAYNAGEYRVLKVMERTGIRDFWEMSRDGLLARETQNYVPAVLAAIALMNGSSAIKR